MRWYKERGFLAAVHSFTSTPGASGGKENGFIPDAELGYKLNPNWVYPGHGKLINSLGIRYPEIPLAKPVGQFRVLVLGDSISWDKGGFVDLLRERFGRLRNGSVEVINAAIPGYTTYQERRFLERDLLPLRPDLVILQYCLNDNHRFLHRLSSSGKWLTTREAELAVLPQSTGWLARLCHSSYLIQTVTERWILVRVRYSGGFPWDSHPHFCTAWQDRTWPIFQEHLLAIREVLRRQGSRLAVIAPPYEPQLDPKYLARDASYTLKPQRFLAEICGRAGVPFLDLHPAFLAHRSTRLFRDGLHLTDAGHRLVADELLKFLEREKLARTASE
jgi:lysophospholipase L1-like esterase